MLIRQIVDLLSVFLDILVYCVLNKIEFCSKLVHNKTLIFIQKMFIMYTEYSTVQKG